MVWHLCVCLFILWCWVCLTNSEIINLQKVRLSLSYLSLLLFRSRSEGPKFDYRLDSIRLSITQKVRNLHPYFLCQSSEGKKHNIPQTFSSHAHLGVYQPCPWPLKAHGCIGSELSILSSAPLMTVPHFMPLYSASLPQMPPSRQNIFECSEFSICV